MFWLTWPLAHDMRVFGSPDVPSDHLFVLSSTAIPVKWKKKSTVTMC